MEALVYAFFVIWLLVTIAMIIKPSIFTNFNIKYFRFILRLMGYEIELKPVSPGLPEKIARIWGAIYTVLFIIFLLHVRSNMQK